MLLPHTCPSACPFCIDESRTIRCVLSVSASGEAAEIELQRALRVYVEKDTHNMWNSEKRLREPIERLRSTVDERFDTVS